MRGDLGTKSRKGLGFFKQQTVAESTDRVLFVAMDNGKKLT